MKAVVVLFMMSLSAAALAEQLPPIKTVFVILMENKDWAQVKNSPDAPFINSVLLPQASYCENYHTPPLLQPSEPNYLWLEAGTNFGLYNNDDPVLNHQSTTNHLVTQLFNAGISWRTYQEDIDGTYVPLTETNGYAPKHNPFVFFDDVTGTNSPDYAYGIEHIRPVSELWSDLASNKLARYNFITPNLCHDMHSPCGPLNNLVQQGDNWLSSSVPAILNSESFRDNGALFIAWDEGDEDSYAPPIGMILLSPLAKGGGYASTNFYNHSSLLRTWQEIFGVRPLLGDAINAQNLADLFLTIKLTYIEQQADGATQVTASGVRPGRTNIFLVSSNMFDWIPISTNYATNNEISITDYSAPKGSTRFYRLLQVP